MDIRRLGPTWTVACEYMGQIPLQAISIAPDYLAVRCSKGEEILASQDGI